MHLTTIKNKKDAERFLAQLFKLGSFQFADENLFKTGTTRLSLNDNGNLVNYSFGMNWCDQYPSIIEDAIGWVYKNRKGINAKIKQQNSR